MAENVTIARPYADAAFELARAGEALSSWSDALASLSVVVQDESVQRCIADPGVSNEMLSRLVLEVEKLSLSAEQQNFVKVLIDNDRLQLMPEITALFHTKRNIHEGTRDALITSAFPLNNDELTTLTAELTERFSARINPIVKVDPELIGGVRIAVGDEVIDASVRGKLADMASALKN